jgi:trehalose 6-phosphate synthase
VTAQRPTYEADFVVVANRLPVDMERLADGTQRWKSSPGGLVAALEPFLRARRGAWVGWPGVPDVEVEPFADDDLTLFPVTLTSADITGYYEGFSNATLWPLYHDVVATPVFDRSW